MRPAQLHDLHASLAAEPSGRFDHQEIRDLPAPVQKYFEAAVRQGSPVIRTARIRMTGRIKIGRWIPFRAEETLTPHRGFVWAARAGGIITGSDRYIDGDGAMDWRILGLLPVMRATGPDVSRSAAERAAAEAIWVPPSLLPRFGASWSAPGPTDITVTFRIDDHHVKLGISITPEGHPQSVHLERWGDPDRNGSFGLHPFGGEFTSHATFGGLTIPTEGRLGWQHGTDRWDQGEFFRFTITDYETSPTPDAP
jgi:hypothetical protein